MQKLLLSTALLSVLLSGCATQQACDSSKHDPSLLEKLNCDVGGGYQQQISQRERDLLDAQAENKLFHEVYVQIEAQQQSVRTDLLSQQKQQAQLQASLNQLLRQLKTKHAAKADTQQQLAALQAQSLRLQSVTSNDPQVIKHKQEQLAELQRQVSRLQLSLGY